jgi:hypothetical protein
MTQIFRTCTATTRDDAQFEENRRDSRSSGASSCAPGKLSDAQAQRTVVKVRVASRSSSLDKSRKRQGKRGATCSLAGSFCEHPSLLVVPVLATWLGD